jgi:hypothetical protein
MIRTWGARRQASASYRESFDRDRKRIEASGGVPDEIGTEEY